MQKDIEKKKAILEEHGFYYDHKKELWFNRALRKIFSEIYVDDHDEKYLIKDIEETKEHFGEWQWYCNEEPSEEVKKDILNQLHQ